MKRFLPKALVGGLCVAAGVALSLFALPEKLTVMAGAPAQQRAVPEPPPPDRTDELLEEFDRTREILAALAQGQADAGTARDALAQRLAEDSARRAGAFEALGGRLDRLDATLRALAVRAAETVVAPAASRIEQPRAPQPAVKPKPTPAAEPRPAPAAEPKPAPRKRKSLAALLATRKRKDVRDTLTRYRLRDGYCRVGFDGTSTIHNFTAKSDKASGSVLLRFNEPADNPSGTITLAVKTLASGGEKRDAEIHEHLGPEIRCDLLGLSKARRRKDGRTEALAKVRFTIRGKSREVLATIVLEFTARRLLHLSGEVKLKMSDYGIHPKAKLGLISVEDELTAWWDLYAEVQRDKA